MKIKFKKEIGVRIKQLIEELQDEGMVVTNIGKNIDVTEECHDYFGNDTPTIVKTFSAKIVFRVPERFIEVEME